MNSIYLLREVLEENNLSNELLAVNKIKNWLMLNKKQIIMYISAYIVAQVITIVFMYSSFSFSEIISGSMRNTLQIGDTIFIDKLAYINKAPERGDIISFVMEEDKEYGYTKRIIGLPGERIWIYNGDVYVNEVKLEEDYIIPFNELIGPFVVPEGKYFVLGDNRPDSFDTRYSGWYVPIDDIEGKVTFSFNLKEWRLSIF